MGITKKLALFLFFCLISSQVFIVPFSQTQETLLLHPDLTTILNKAAEYCEKLYNARLDFVCLEEIKEKIHFAGKIGFRFWWHLRQQKTNYHYLYDYQMIRKDDKTTEKRILLEENGKRSITGIISFSQLKLK